MAYLRGRRLAAVLLCAMAGMPLAAQQHRGAADARSDEPLSAAMAVTDPRVARALRDPQRLAWLAEGEVALQRGDTDAALQAFERAAGLLHAADSELGLVRAALQAGRYREALAFCAHTAGAHRESPGAAALYALLLAVAGQGAFAQQTLVQARERLPSDGLLGEAQALVSAGFGVPTQALLQPPHRLAPQTLLTEGQPQLPSEAAVRGGAVLLGDGHHALAPLRLLEGARTLWLRDGLGHTVAARRLRNDPAAGVALLALDAGLAPPGLAYAAAPLRAGRSGFAVAQVPQLGQAHPAWPWLFRGFIGQVSARDGRQALGIDVPPMADGVLVLDAEGRVAGIGLLGPRGMQLEPAARWQESNAPATDSAAVSPATTLPADAVYERALRVALQLIAAP
jgi:tetratricopeptide (TPR) repeat protein